MADKRKSPVKMEQFVLCVVEETPNLVPATIKQRTEKEIYVYSEYELPNRKSIHMFPCDPSETATAETILHHPQTIHGTIIRANWDGLVIIKLEEAAPAKTDSHPKHTSTKPKHSKPTVPDRSEYTITKKGSKLTIQAKQHPGNITIKISGTVDVEGAAILDGVVRKALPNVLCVILECSDIDMLPSAGLGVLISMVRDLRAKNIPIAMAAVPKSIKRVLEISRLHSLVTCYDSLEAAYDDIWK